jgi:AcrR family transcriptional regulator
LKNRPSVFYLKIMGEIGVIRTNEIIEAAITEFIEKGYANASMESIAKRANLSKGGLYHHFKSKTEILLAVNMKFMEPVQEMMFTIEGNPSVADGLKQYIKDYLAYWNTHQRELSLYFLTMNESFINEPIMKLYKESTREMFDFFESIILKGQQQEIFKERDARAHAIAMISCLDGFLGYVLIDSSLSIEKMESEIQNTFITDLLK